MKITDHVWRALMGSNWAQRARLLERGCGYMNCGRPIGEHVQASMPIGLRGGKRKRVNERRWA